MPWCARRVPSANSAVLLSQRLPFDYRLAPSGKFAQDMDEGMDKTIGDAMNVSGGVQPPGLVSSFSNR